MRSQLRVLVCASLLGGMQPVVHAQEQSFDIGLRVEIHAADGEPANDIPGAGVFAHYVLNDQWSLGAAIARTEYDFEEPAQIVGIRTDPQLEPIDALAEATTLSIWVERFITDRDNPTTFFVGGGLGAAFVDVPDAQGPRADGGRFDVRTEADTEIVATLFAGVRRRFLQRWHAEFALRAEQHFADWQVTDRISGARGAIDDYRAFGGYLGVGVRW